MYYIEFEDERWSTFRRGDFDAATTEQEMIEGFLALGAVKVMKFEFGGLQPVA